MSNKKTSTSSSNKRRGYVTAATLLKESEPVGRRWKGQTEFLKNLEQLVSHSRTKASQVQGERKVPINEKKSATISKDIYTNPLVGQWYREYPTVLVQEYHLRPPQWFLERVERAMKRIEQGEDQAGGRVKKTSSRKKSGQKKSAGGSKKRKGSGRKRGSTSGSSSGSSASRSTRSSQRSWSPGETDLENEEDYEEEEKKQERKRKPGRPKKQQIKEEEEEEEESESEMQLAPYVNRQEQEEVDFPDLIRYKSFGEAQPRQRKNNF